MKIALISDIHANLPALEAVLTHTHEMQVDVIFNLGDMLGVGPYPDEVVRRVRKNGIPSILGNVDRKVLKFPGKYPPGKAWKSPRCGVISCGPMTSYQKTT